LDEYDPTIEDSYRKKIIATTASTTMNSTNDMKIDDPIHGRPFAKPKVVMLDILDTAGPGFFTHLTLVPRSYSIIGCLFCFNRGI
jgi:hypothetical protein